MRRKIIPYNPVLKERAKELRKKSTFTESHYFKERKDEKRQKRIEELGVKILRFEDTDIIYKLDVVIKTIEKWIDENAIK